MSNNNPPDLWPSDIFATTLRAPVTLLKEQAALLTEKSSRLICGKVQSEVEEYPEKRVIHSLRARVPDLGNYEVELVSIAHAPQMLYPVWVSGRDGGQERQLRDEADYTKWLRGELGSPWVVRTLQTLVAQVRDPEARPPGSSPKGGSEVDYGDIPF